MVEKIRQPTSVPPIRAAYGSSSPIPPRRRSPTHAEQKAHVGLGVLGSLPSPIRCGFDCQPAADGRPCGSRDQHRIKRDFDDPDEHWEEEIPGLRYICLTANIAQEHATEVGRPTTVKLPRPQSAHRNPYQRVRDNERQPIKTRIGDGEMNFADLHSRLRAASCPPFP